MKIKLYIYICSSPYISFIKKGGGFLRTISPTIFVCYVIEQCKNNRCMAADCDSTCDCVKVIFI